MEDILQNNDRDEENIPEIEKDPFSDLVYEEQFSLWEATEEELFRCRLLCTGESFVSLIKSYLKWCNTYTSNLKDLVISKEDSRYFVLGKVVNDQGESIWKEFIDQERQKDYETEEELVSMEIDTFGFLDIMPVTDDLLSPIEVRIVSTNERMTSFWGVLIKYIRQSFLLDYLKPEIWQLGKSLPDKMDLQEIVKLPSANMIIVKKLSPGRKSNHYYDQAFERIQMGMDYEQAYTKFLRETGILNKTPRNREKFTTAMRRRRKPT